jgi:hypothetical protein
MLAHVGPPPAYSLASLNSVFLFLMNLRASPDPPKPAQFTAQHGPGQAVRALLSRNDGVANSPSAETKEYLEPRGAVVPQPRRT